MTMRHWVFGGIGAVYLVFRLLGGSGSATFASGPAQVIRPVPGKSWQSEVVLSRQSDGHFYADVLINGRPLHVLVDTGATAIALTRDDAEALGVWPDPKAEDVLVKGASGTTKGSMVRLRHVSIGKKEGWNMRAIVLSNELDVSLLGQNFLAQLGSVRMENDKMILR